MKDYDKEIENIFLDEEEDVLQRIRIVYQNSLKDVQAYAKSLQKELDELLKNVDPNDEIGLTKIRSKVYQLGYQKKLAQQINNYLDVIKDKDVNNITDYINKVYSNGFLTEQYRLMRSGIDITMPINQKLLKKAVTFNIDDIPLSTRLYTNVDKAKKEIINEISRGLSIGMSVSDMARNLQNTMGVSMRKAYQIAQNEGARVRQSAIIDSMREAKKKGADIVKQWSATLDEKTRPVHQELDGEWAEIEDDFKYSGGKVFAPKQFGIPSEDINCRCTLLSVPRWDIEDKHWQLDNESKELVKVKNYKDWYEKVNKRYGINNGVVINSSNVYGDKLKSFTSRGIEIPSKVKEYLQQLEKNEYIEGAKGSFEISDLRIMSIEKNIEYTVITIGDTSYLIRGAERGTTISKELLEKLLENKGTFDFHSHPYRNDITPSASDLKFLSMLTWQDFSQIIDEDGTISTFNVNGIIETKNIKHSEESLESLQELYNNLFKEV